jgi:hypothetical protein
MRRGPGQATGQGLSAFPPPQTPDAAPGYEFLEQRMVRRTVGFIEPAYGDDPVLPASDTVTVTDRLTPPLRGVVAVLDHALLCCGGDAVERDDGPYPASARAPGVDPPLQHGCAGGAAGVAADVEHPVPPA